MYFLPHVVLLVMIGLIATSVSALWPRDARGRSQWWRQWWPAVIASAAACAATFAVGRLHPMVSSVYAGPWISGLLATVVCFIDCRLRVAAADLDAVRASPEGSALVFRHHIVRFRHITVLTFAGYLAGCMMNMKPGSLASDLLESAVPMFYWGLPVIALLAPPGGLIGLRRVDPRLAARYLYEPYAPLLRGLAGCVGIFGGAVALSALVIWLFY